MSTAKVVSQALKGKITFAAATSGYLMLGKGGYKPDEMNVQVSPMRRRTFTIDIAAAANDTAYALVIDGVTKTYTSDGSATAPEVLAGVRALFSGNSRWSVGASTDGDTFPVTLVDEDGPGTLTAGSNTTVTAALETAPSYRVIKESGKITIETTAAWTGAFDVLVSR